MTPLVTPSWLAARLQDPTTIIFDATLPPVGVTPTIDTHARYLATHIPGAIFFDIEDLSDHATTLPHMLPTPEAFSQSMSALGVSDTSTIVIYAQQGVFSAPRAWWMLRTFGAPLVYILEGGLRAWKDSGLPIESGSVHRIPSGFHATLRRNAVVDLDQLKDQMAKHQQILDARSAGRFN